MNSRKMCKGEYVRAVKGIVPSALTALSRTRAAISFDASYERNQLMNWLDISTIWNIIVFTDFNRSDLRSLHAGRSKQARQARCLAATRHTQPAPGRRHSYAVRVQRV